MPSNQPCVAAERKAERAPARRSHALPRPDRQGVNPSRRDPFTPV